MAMSKKALMRKRLQGRKTMGTIKSLVGLTTFLEQVTSKDRVQYSSLPMMQKAQAVINNVTGNVFGINIFNGVPKFSQKINPAGIANKWTGIGLAAIGYQLLSKHSPVKLPHAGKVGSFGKPILFSGLIGGFFDDPPGFSHGTTFQQVTSYASQTPSYVLAGQGSVISGGPKT